jgi:hypothetical protein
MYHEFTDVLARAGAKLSIPMLTGNSSSFMVGRLSYTFGFSGPCVSTDTACSSSLVAAHLGAKGLQAKEVQRAVAAGINLIMSPTTTVALCTLQALSPDGRCKTFDSSADGYGRGEGCIVMMLHAVTNYSYDDSTTPSERIILKSTVLNQDGRSSSLTSPNGPAQAALIRTAMHGGTLTAGYTPALLSYIAVHGTGTALGDPIEVNALSLATSDQHKNGSNTWSVNLGSVKACNGHTEGAAGLSGLLLATSALCHGAALPLMHLRQVNPYVESSLMSWTNQGRPMAMLPRQLMPCSTRLSDGLAGTSSFGMSGVNAHAILDWSQHSGGPEEHKHSAYFGHRSRYWPAAHAHHLYYFQASTSSPRLQLTNGYTRICQVDCAPSRYAALASVMMGIRVLSAAVTLDIMCAAVRVLSTRFSDIVMLRTLCPPMPLAGMEGAQVAGMYNEEGGPMYLRCTIESRDGSVRLTQMQQSGKEESQLEAYAEVCIRILLQPGNAPKSGHSPSTVAHRSLVLSSAMTKHDEMFSAATACIDVSGVRESNEKALSPVAHQAAMTLAASYTSLRQPLWVQACAAFVNSQNPCNSELLNVSASLSCTSITGGSSMHGLVAKPLISTAVSIPKRASWEVVWNALNLQRSSTTEFKSGMMPWLAISAQPICKQQLWTESSPGFRDCHALTALWATEVMGDDDFIEDMHSVDVAVSCQTHLEWLMHASLCQHCFYVDIPLKQTMPSCQEMNPDTQLEAAQVQGMVATVRAVLNCERQVKVSLLTVNARHIEPFTFQPRTRVALLTGIANTIFMEHRGVFGPLIDIDGPIPADLLTSVLTTNGEFSVAVREGRTYVLRFMSSANNAVHTAARRVDHVKSAFVAGGTKVRVLFL